MNYLEKEIKKILNRQKIVSFEMYGNEITITTEDNEIVLTSSDTIFVEVNNREFVE